MQITPSCDPPIWPHLKGTEMRTIGTMIINMLEAQHGPAYGGQKRKRLEGESDGGIIFWASTELDAQNQLKFAAALGITVTQLQTAGHVLRQAWNA